MLLLFLVLLWLWNLVKVVGIFVIGIVVFFIICVYVFVCMCFSGKVMLLKGMLIFQMFLVVFLLVVLYVLFDCLGEYILFIGLNIYGGVIFVYLGGIVLYVWIIKGYFEIIDSLLEEVVVLDGVILWQVFCFVLLLLLVLILVVVFILLFIVVIIEVLVVLLLLCDVNSYILVVGMQ